MSNNRDNKIVLRINTDEKTIIKYSDYIKFYKDVAAAMVALCICYIFSSFILGIVSYFGLLYFLSILKFEAGHPKKEDAT